MISKSQRNYKQITNTRNLIQDAFLSLANETSKSFNLLCSF